MLSAILKELDSSILADQTLTRSALDRLLISQRKLGLVFGDRPTCPFLRPHIISRSQYDEISRAATVIAGALEKVVARSLQDNEIMELLGATKREQKMAQVDPGYTTLCVTSRLDSYASDSGFKFLEYNAETPAGVGDQLQLEKVLFELDHNRVFLDQKPHWRPAPHRRLLKALLEAYREWGGTRERPQIAIVDWKGVATESEFYVLRDYFAAQGYHAAIADPRELGYNGGRLTVKKFRIDIVYKRVIIHEFLARCDEDHPMARAYADRRVCLINSFRTKLAHKKAGFAVLSDPRHNELFTAEEIEICRRHIPWTRRISADDPNLIHQVSTDRQRFVLKPNDDYGGHGVFLGWETTDDEWKQAIRLALQKPYVVQERVALDKMWMPMFSDRVRMEQLFVDFNPFLFHNEVEGALVRLSSSSLLNVTSGGGQTALLVLEGL